jgi:hypothetical protein
LLRRRTPTYVAGVSDPTPIKDDSKKDDASEADARRRRLEATKALNETAKVLLPIAGAAIAYTLTLGVRHKDDVNYPPGLAPGLARHGLWVGSIVVFLVAFGLWTFVFPCCIRSTWDGGQATVDPATETEWLVRAARGLGLLPEKDSWFRRGQRFAQWGFLALVVAVALLSVLSGLPPVPLTSGTPSPSEHPAPAPSPAPALSR